MPTLAHVPEESLRLGVRFLQVYDIGFRSLFAFFVMDVNTKQVIHVAVTREPNQKASPAA